jgi:hypothetical protein
MSDLQSTPTTTQPVQPIIREDVVNNGIIRSIYYPDTEILTVEGYDMNGVAAWRGGVNMATRELLPTEMFS